MSTNSPHVLAMVAHPDDESFGLGAVLAWLCNRTFSVSAVVFTHGEASTLGPDDPEGDLGTLRASELGCASGVLGLSGYKLHSYPDGRLNESPFVELVERGAVVESGDLVIAFDDSGITGHPDHIAATEVAKALATARGAGLYLWSLPEDVADNLNARFNTSFIGRPKNELTITLDVANERELQWKAIRCHQSQSEAFDLVQARLELLGGFEYLIERIPVKLSRSPFVG